MAFAQGGMCGLCGMPLSVRGTDVDHIVPVSRGGKSSRLNLRLTCARCNRKRGNKT